LREIPEITGMRGYASLGVVVFHLFTLNSALRALGFPPIVLAWNSGVDFFFVLSGFLLSLPFLGEKHVNLKTYYVKRVFRILPVYYLSIAICGTIMLFLNYGTVQQILASLVFAQSLSPSTFNSINGVNWTLVIEEIFYATLPAFSLLFRGRRWMISLPTCLAFSLGYRIAMVSLFQQDGLAFHLWQYPSFMGHFALGLTLANFYVHGKVKPGGASNALLGAILALVVATQYLIGATFSIGNNVLVLPGVLLALEFAALIFAVLASPADSVLRRVFSNRVMTSAGKISYSTYTWHLPIEVGLSQLGLPLFAWVGFSLASAISVAVLSYRRLELPCLNLRDRILAGKQARPRVRGLVEPSVPPSR
jgi:peptidoglycan/LPS O-acetylase OafA/YrhL